MRSVVIAVMLVVSIVAVSAFADDPFSASSVPYAVGTGPRGLCTADLDGDGELDLAVANANSNDVSVLLGVGDGTFAAAISYAAGIGPSGVCAADVNNDTHLDLAVSNWGTNNVSILINNGSGVFAAPVNYSAGVSGNAPRAICAAQLNGVGYIDLAVANEWGDSVAVLINNDDGTFLDPVTYHLGVDATPYSICCADFDGSGSNDVAVANSGTDNVSILINNGSGVLAAPVNYSVGTGPRGVSADDLDGNGSPDLAVANFGSHDVSVLKNNGDGTFGAASNYTASGSATRGICTAELDGDVYIDVAAVTNTSNEAAVLLNAGDGTLEEPALDYAVGLGPVAICSGNFDGDTDNDLAVADFGDNTVTILLNGSDILVDADDNMTHNGLPTQACLHQNYPNPFNPTTVIPFSLPNRSHVSVTVYNALGQKVCQLADGQFTAGDHVVYWDGRNVAGDPVAGGVYLYKLQTDSIVESRKMLLVK